MPVMRVFRAFLCFLLLWPAAVLSAELGVSLHFPSGFFAAALERAPAATFDNGPCSTLTVAGRRLEARADGLYLLNPVSAAIGARLRDGCGERLVWSGVAALRLDPYVDGDWRLHFRIGSAELKGDEGAAPVGLALLWKLASGRLEEEAAAVTLDLAPAREELAAVLHAAAPERTVALTLGQVEVDAEGLVLRLDLRFAGVEGRHHLAAPRDLVAEQQQSQALDAFLVFVVKQAGRDVADPALRRRLLELLLGSRAVAETEGVHGALCHAWSELQSILDEAAQQKLITQARLRRWSLLLGGGETLLALDAARPGGWIDRDGLQRLARVLQPKSGPLEYREGVDPQLRHLFGFPPEASSDRAAPAGSLLDWFIHSARAEGEKVLSEVGKRLRNWVPRRWELPEYRAWVSALLTGVVDEEVERAKLEASEAAVLRALVPATALMESCWHQFARNDGKVGAVISPGGSVGIMQVNAHTWRGFYDRGRLERDVIYNVRAGTQILLRYLKDPGRRIAARTGELEHLGRAAYAAYNGGPGAASRFIKSGVLRPGPRDRKFWGFYQGFAAGNVPNLNKCAIRAP